MSFLGYNAHAMLAKLRYELQGSRKAGSSLTYTDAHLLTELNHAYAQLQKELQLHSTERSGALTSGEQNYSLPDNVSGLKVKEIRVLNRTGNGSTPLSRRTKDYMRNFYALDDTGASVQGSPADWGPHQSNSRQVTIRPVPNYTSASGLLFYFTVRHAPLHRIWRPGSLGTPITAGVVNGDPDVTLSGAIDTEIVQVGDHVGVIPTLNKDQSVVADENPIEWYEILTLATPVITLTENYTGETDTTVDIIVAQVSELEVAFPDKMGWVPVYMAAAEMLDRSDPQAADRMRAKAGRVTATEQPDEDFTELLRPRGAVETNMLRD